MATEIINKQLVIPVNINDHNVELLFLGKKYNHNYIVLKNCDTGELSKYNAPKSEDRHGWYLQTIELTSIDSGFYSVYTETADGAEESLESTFTVLGIKNKELVSNMLTQTGRDAEATPYKELIENNVGNTTDLIRSLFDTYIDTHNKYSDERKQAAAITLKLFVDRFNASICTNTSKDNSVDKYSNRINYGDDIHLILDVDFTEDNEYIATPYKTQLNEDYINIPKENNSLHLFIFVNEDNEYSDIRICFTPTDDILKQFWTKEKSGVDSYNAAIEKIINYPKNYLSFSDEEQKILAIFEDLIPVQPIFKGSALNYANGKISVNLDYDYPLISAMNKNFYIAFRELELAMDSSTRRRKLISGESFSFYAKSIGILDEPYVAYISDEDDNVLSPPVLINLLGIYSTQYTGDYEDSADIEIDTDSFTERYRQYLLYKYGQHMKLYLQKYYPDIAPGIYELYDKIYSDNDTNSVDAPYELIDGSCTHYNSSSFYDICKALYEDNTIYGSYLVKYFTENVNYYYKENSVRIPPIEDTLFVFDSYYIDGYRTREYMDCDTQVNSRYRFNDKCSYGVFWALHKKTYARSGFVLIDMTQDITRPSFSAYLMDAVQAVN